MSPAREKRDDKQNQKDKEKDLSDPRCGPGNSDKTENSCNNRDNQKHQSP